MSGPDFFQTQMGHQFYLDTMPRVAKSLERIATAFETGSAPIRRPLNAPLGVADLRARARENRICEIIQVDLAELLENSEDLEWLNDEASRQITGDESGLMDLYYRVVGHVEERGGAVLSGGILLEVDAALDNDWLETK